MPRGFEGAYETSHSSPDVVEYSKNWQRTGKTMGKQPDKQPNPSQGQVKKFWDYFGVKPEKVYEQPFFLRGAYYLKYPPIDLNNLFRLAVPGTLGKIAKEHVYTNTGARTFLFNRWVTRLEITSDDAIALFQVIREIIEESR